MADQTESYGALGKFTGVTMAPDRLTIVGIDVPIETCPDLADDMERLGAPLEEDMVLSMLDIGVIDPVLVRKFRGDANVYVVDGRRRVLHAREANRRRTGKDRSPVTVKCIPFDGDPLDGLIVANNYRRDDTMAAKAAKAARMKARGDSIERIARFFTVDKQTVATWFAYKEAPIEAKADEANGKMAPTVVAEIGKVAPAKRKDALAAARAAGGKGAKAVDAVRQAAKGKDVTVHANNKMTMGQLRKLQDLLAPTEEEPFEKGDESLELAYHLVSCILGENPSALCDFPEVQKEFRKALKRGKADA